MGGTQLFHVSGADSEARATVLIMELLMFSSFSSDCEFNRETNMLHSPVLFNGISTFVYWQGILLLWTFKLICLCDNINPN